MMREGHLFTGEFNFFSVDGIFVCYLVGGEEGGGGGERIELKKINNEKMQYMQHKLSLEM